MAQVWAATDTVLGRRVAVKLLHPHLRGDASLVRRFRQEGRLSARLTDPNIVGVYDTVATADADAIVMEFVEGSTLRQLLDRRGRLDPATVVDIGCRVADALDAAHRHHLTHRDIKPANILLCADGGVKVADFGIAKTGEFEDLTQDGTVLGTATYLAPEQLNGAETDGRSDLYSLGVVLYEAAVGHPPFTGETEAARAMQRLTQVPVPPHRVDATVPAALSRCIMRLLERDPDRRPHDAHTARMELAGCLMPTAPQVEVASPPPAPPPRRADAHRRPAPRRATPPPPRRSRLGVAVLVLLIGSAVALIAALLQQETGSVPRSGTTVGQRRTTSSAVEQVVVPVASVVAFDPEGSGTPGENNRLVAASHDGDPATAWRTEGYLRQDFGTKRGVGLAISLERARALSRVEITSPSIGWAASVYVLDSIPPGPPQGQPVAVVDSISGDRSIPLHGQRGRVVLLWITRLGSGGPPYRVDIAELHLVGDP